MKEKLKNKFKFAIHNIVGHPVMEVLGWFGFSDLARKAHDLTLPKNK